MDAMSRSRSGTSVPNPLYLAPEPSAAGVARAWVGEVLAGWPQGGVETARLLVSELVTNAVLHARTAIAVTFRVEGTRARFDVHDQQHNGPVPKRYAPDSATGRGMRLVASLAEDWGVERDDGGSGGKTVWFTVSPSTRVVPPLDLASARAVPPEELEELEGVAPLSRREVHAGGTAPHVPVSGCDAPIEGREDAGMVDVQVLALPLDVYLEAEQHNDAIVRELTLIVQSAGSAGSAGSAASAGSEVPRRLLELAHEVREAFSPTSDSLREQVEEAISTGRETLDIHVAVPRHGWEALLGLADWLDEVDRYCVQGELLTLESSPRLRRFRAWYARQVADQMKGLPPTPWEPTP